MIVGKIWWEKWQAFSLYRGRDSLFRALLRWCIWGLRCALKWPAVVDIAPYSMRLYLLPRWKGCWKAIFVFRERFFEISDPELEFVRRILKPGDIFIDVGSYHGWYALAASAVVGESGLVLAFEPNSHAYSILVRNIALSGRQNVRAFNIALSSTRGKAWLYTGPGDESSSALAFVPGGRGGEQVTASRLDDILAESNIREVSALKLDVQGSEAALLKGAMGALKRSRPVVVFEVDPDAAETMAVSPRGAWDLLASLGYAFFRFSDGALTPLPAFPKLQVGTFLNIVAVPPHQESIP